jgi:putative heme-binding domain-containing protein
MRPKRLLFSLAVLPAIAHALPEGFVIREFGGPPNLEYPTALSAAANGDVYVSSDKNGSLGHVPHYGKIVRARDTDGDGKADQFVDFVPDVNSPRGGHFTGGTFYLIHPPYLSSYRDTNGDGVADETKTLVTGFGWGIEHPRGADHTTNGVRMGIDGWLYVAVGDFGMPDATGADGKHVTLQGGGVARVRPDGSELELYSTMTRNICDVAISPYLDLFSRDNTNDGKGWNTRFHHLTELASPGYPRLYQNFIDEIAQPLADYGGGSGTGGLYLHEPGFPKNFGDMVYTCDWTTGNIYNHPMKPFEATFVAEQEVFEKLTRAIDIDVDGFSRLYVADWRNGGFSFSEDKQVGFIQQIIVPGETPASYIDVTKAKDAELPALLASRSGVQRLEAQREILARGKKPEFAKAIHAIAKDAAQPLYGRVAAIFTFKQLYGKDSTKPLLELVTDDAVREFALRAMTDRVSELDGVPAQPYLDALKDKNPRVALQASIGLARLKDQAKGSTAAILAAAATWPRDESKLGTGEHYRLPHTAVKALVKIGDVKTLLNAVTESPAQRDTALRALQEIQGVEATDGLIAIADSTTDDAIREAVIKVLARLYNIEKPWDLKSWWSTRPDDRGPYFEPVAWEGTPKVKAAIERAFVKLPEARQLPIVQIIAKNRVPLGELKLGNLDPVIVALDADKIYDAQIAILIDAAKSPKRPWDQRIECYRGVLKAGGDNKLDGSLGILAEWAGEKDLAPAAAQSIQEFINDSQRGNEVDGLLKLGASQGDAASRIAWKSLLTVLNSPLAKPDAKKKVRAGIDKNPREIGFFQALADLKLSGFDPQIEIGINSDNRILIDAAKAAQAAAGSVAATGKKVGDLPPAEVAKHAMDSKGDVATGARLFTAQGCIACHAIDLKAEQKGPYLGAAGAKFTRDYLIDSVLEPSKVVAQGFRTAVFNLKDGSSKMGFVTGEADGVVSLRDIAGQASKLNRADVAGESELPTSMMPPDLAAPLTLDDFTSLIEYLASLKSVGG